MSLLRQLDTSRKLYAGFAIVLCLGIALTLWLLGQFGNLHAVTARTGQKLSAAQAHFAAVRIWAWVLLALMATAAVAVAAWVQAEVARPVREAAAIARRLAEGDLSTRIGPAAAGAGGELLSGMQHMNDKLAGMIIKVRAGTESVASSAGDIAAGSVELGVRLAEQAASLDDIAASLAQLTASAAQGAQLERLGAAIAQLQQASYGNLHLAERSAAAAASMRGQAGSLSRATAAFSLGKNYALPTPAIHLVSNNPHRLVRLPAHQRAGVSPVRAVVSNPAPAAPAPMRSRGNAAPRDLDWENV